MEQLMSTMEEKAQVIEQKLLKYDSVESNAEEEQKQSENNQLVLYQGITSNKGEYNEYLMGDSNLVPIITNESATTQASSLMLVPSFGQHVVSKPINDEDEFGIISLSDVDDDAIDQMILSKEESQLKKNIWDSLNRDWIKAQKVKRRQKKEERKRQKEARRKDKELRKRIAEEKRQLSAIN